MTQHWICVAFILIYLPGAGDTMITKVVPPGRGLALHLASIIKSPQEKPSPKWYYMDVFVQTSSHWTLSYFPQPIYVLHSDLGAYFSYLLQLIFLHYFLQIRMWTLITQILNKLKFFFSIFHTIFSLSMLHF